MSRERSAPERVPHFDAEGTQVDVVIPSSKPDGGLVDIPPTLRLLEVACEEDPRHLLAVLVAPPAGTDCLGVLMVAGSERTAAGGTSPKARVLAALTTTGLAPVFHDYGADELRILTNEEPTLRKFCGTCRTHKAIVAAALCAALDWDRRGVRRVLVGVAKPEHSADLK